MEQLLRRVVKPALLTAVLGFLSFSLYPQTFAGLEKPNVPDAIAKEQSPIAKNYMTNPALLVLVRGTIVDEKSQPLPGVSVIEKGTTNGTTTDVSGKYTLNVQDENSVLVFSFIGYASQTIIVGSKSSIDITMQPDTKVLEEVVVVGYGTQRKQELTSAVTNVSSEDFNKGPVSNSPLQLIQGKVPGLAISRANGGDPTAEVQIQMRGVSTVKGNLAPLIVIDGVPGGNLNTVAPEDIESMDVLRDGSASAIYGTRGSNGVIIVTTRKGKSGTPRLEYSNYFYSDTYMNKLEVLNAEDWRNLKVDFANSSNPVLQNKASAMIDYGGNTDWFDAISQKKLSQVHNLSLSGGNENTTYYAALNYRDIQGLITRSFNRIFNYRISLTSAVLNDRLVFDLNVGGTNGKSRPSNYGMFTSALLRNPTFPIYNPDGTFHEEPDLSGGNLVAQLYSYENDQQRIENLMSARATLNITDGLKASVMGSLQRYNDIGGAYYYHNAYASVIGGYRDLNGEASRSSQQSLDRTFETLVTYDKTLGTDHRLNVVGGYNYQDFQYEAFGASNRNFINDDFLYNNLNAGKALSDGIYKTNDVWSTKRSSKLIAFFARAIYSFKDKYLLTVGVRQEGSSKFGNDNKWGTFPAVTAGWRIGQENFMSDNNTINELKLRVGYGVTGNQGVQEYVSLEKLSVGGSMLYNGTWITGYGPSSNPNPNLRWEKKAETNFGLDLGLLENKVVVNLDFYYRKTTDLLFEYAVPVPPNLYPTLWTNVGEISNKGVEFAIAYTPYRKSNFSWTTGFNISYNQNKLVSLSNDFYKTTYLDFEEFGAPGLGSVYAYRLEEGQPVGNMYGFGFAGFDEDGKWLFWDKDNENKIGATAAQYEDKRIIGNGLPKSWFGFTNDFTFGHFDASVLIRGALGFDVVNVKRLYYENRKLIPSNILKSSLESPVIDDPQFSDYYVENGNFIKLDVISIGYTLPIKSSVISKARFFVATKNLYIFSNYKGSDPELDINGLSPGFDRKENTGTNMLTKYPSTRTISFGCNIKF